MKCTLIPKTTNVTVVSKESNSFAVFAKTYSGKLSNHFTIDKVYVVHELFHFNEVFLNGNNFHTNTLNFCEFSYFIFLEEECEKFWIFFLNFFTPCQGEVRALKCHSLSLKGLRLISSQLRQLSVWLILSGSGNTASLHSMVSSLTKAAKTMRIVKFYSFLFVFAQSFVHDSITLMLINTFLIFTTFCLVTTSFDHSMKVFLPCAY